MDEFLLCLGRRSKRHFFERLDMIHVPQKFWSPPETCGRGCSLGGLYNFNLSDVWAEFCEFLSMFYLKQNFQTNRVNQSEKGTLLGWAAWHATFDEGSAKTSLLFKCRINFNQPNRFVLQTQFVWKYADCPVNLFAS